MADIYRYIHSAREGKPMPRRAIFHSEWEPDVNAMPDRVEIDIEGTHLSSEANFLIVFTLDEARAIRRALDEAGI